MNFISKWFKSKHKKPQAPRKKIKVEKEDSLISMHRRMTNWQNSQWMRSGGPGLRSEDAQFVSATYYLNLKRRKRRQ